MAAKDKSKPEGLKPIVISKFLLPAPKTTNFFSNVFKDGPLREFFGKQRTEPLDPRLTSRIAGTFNDPVYQKLPWIESNVKTDFFSSKLRNMLLVNFRSKLFTGTLKSTEQDVALRVIGK